MPVATSQQAQASTPAPAQAQNPIALAAATSSFDKTSVIAAASPPAEKPAPTPDTSTADPGITPDAKDPLSAVEQILSRAEDFNQKYPDYVCRLSRLERTRGPMRDPELILMKFRRHPRSVHLKWLDAPNLGRECVYVEGQNRGKMISRGGKGDLLLAGRTLWLDPNGSLARSKSTQPITESGIDVVCSKIRRRVDHLQQGDNSFGTLTYEEGADPINGENLYRWIVHQCPAGVDGDLLSGGVHRYGFLKDSGRLEVVHAFDGTDRHMYTFRFERFIPVTGLVDADFDPDQLWPRKEVRRRPEGEENLAGKETPAPE